MIGCCVVIFRDVDISIYDISSGRVIPWSRDIEGTQKKRRPRVAHSQTEAFALPIESNKQQETYADITMHIVQKKTCAE